MRAAPSPTPATLRATAGFSLVEVLIAALLLLVVALGVLPIFTRSMVASLSGNDASQASNFGRSRMEELYQLPFNSPGLAVTAGIEARAVEWWSPANRSWRTGPQPPVSPWTRTTRVRQFALGGLVDADEDGEWDEPLDAGADPAFVHLKEIEVRLESNRTPGSPLGGARPITLRVLKPY